MRRVMRRAANAMCRKSWMAACLYYRLWDMALEGGPGDEVWYFAFGANMHDSAFRDRRRMTPDEWRAGRIKGCRLRFNLNGRAAPDAEAGGVFYKITRGDLVRLDSTEGVPGRHYRHLWVEAEDGAERRRPS